MERKVQLDFLRGLLLIIITVDHFLTANNVVRFFTYEFVGWATAAEGFVFLSGLTAGLVYTHKFFGKGEEMLSAASRRRSFMIYRNHILLFLIIALIVVNGFAENFWEKDYVLFTQKPALAIISGLFLLHQPKFMDILPMYFVFMLFVPIAIKCFQKGYARHLLAASMTLYLVGFTSNYCGFTTALTQFMNLDAQGFDSGNFNLLCWQLLFFVGLLAGYLFYNGKTQQWQTDRRLLWVATCIGLGLFVLKLLVARVNYAGSTLDYLTLKSHLGPLRLLNFSALAFVVTYFASKHGSWFRSKPITYLGRHSLEVFSFHVLLVIVFYPLKEYLNTVWALQVTHSLYLYPLATMMIIFCMVPALFLAPILLSKKTYAHLFARI